MKTPSITLSTKTILLTCAAVCMGLLAYALYAQHVQGLAPCPLCVLQRYAFITIALACLVGAFIWRYGVAVIVGLIASLAGAGTATHHLWVKANPHTSCGIDPLETAINKVPLGQWLPQMFYADGLCSADHAPIFGLNIPQWSLVWFVIFAFAMLYILFRKSVVKAI